MSYVKSGSDAFFVSSDCFSMTLIFSMTCKFLLKQDMIRRIIGTGVNKPLMYGVLLICLGVRLCVMLAVTVGARRFIFLQAPCFWSPTPLTLGFPKYSSERRSVSGSSSSFNALLLH